MRDKIKHFNIKILRIILLVFWLVLCVYILLSFWVNPLAWTDGETYTLYFLKMTIISFPSGMIAGTVCDLLLTAFDVFTRKGNVIFIWLSVVILGGWQWFFFFPTMYNLLKRKFGNGKSAKEE